MLMGEYFFIKLGLYRPSRSGYNSHLCNKTEIKRSVRTEFSLKIGDSTLSARPILLRNSIPLQAKNLNVGRLKPIKPYRLVCHNLFQIMPIMVEEPCEMLLL